MKKYSFDKISKVLQYNPKTGKLFWLHRTDAPASWNTRYAGKEAFTANLNGYLCGRVFGKFFYAHRVAWLIMTGSWPEEIDHIDGNRANNIFENLRSVSHQENLKNITMQSNNKSGHIGIYWNKRYKKWHAQIGVEGKQRHIGYFSNLKDAVCARKEAEIKFDYHNNHGKGMRK